MRVRGALLTSGPTGALVSAVSLVLLLAPNAGPPEHELLHAGAASVHDEASHPSAAPHIDLEEHLDFEECLGCLGTGHAVEHVIRWWQHAPLEVPSPVPHSEKLLDSSVLLSGPPRAPPA